jgi:hypothetical protein
MRPLTAEAHGIMDYVVGTAGTALPWIMHFSDDVRATQAMSLLEAGTVALTALSDHEVALSRQIPMDLHLHIDLIEGALLAASPWLFGFHRRVWLPHLLLGLGAIGAALMTETMPRDRF